MPTFSWQTILIITVAAALIYYLWQKRETRSGEGGGFGGSVLENFTRDLTALARQEKLDPVVGRDEEIERTIHILCRRTKNNPILLGGPGVGKTAVVEGLARKIATADVPEILQNKRLLALDLTNLISGTKYRGEFEQRMKKLTEEIKKMARQIILFIDEVHMIAETKGTEGALYLSDILKPALARGDLQMIGATTTQEYKRLIKPDDALERRLQPVIVKEPSVEETIVILHGIKNKYEEHHHVRFETEALRAAATLSDKYIKERLLPDKAIDLLDEAGAKVSIESSHLKTHLEKIIPEKEDIEIKMKTLREQEAKLKKEINHLETIDSGLQKEVELQEIKKRMVHLLSMIQKMAEEETWKREGRGLPVVTVSDIIKIVADWTKLPIESIKN
jgi:ATP-dependent Clp protease ATP-binding subunit ClpA